MVTFVFSLFFYLYNLNLYKNCFGKLIINKKKSFYNIIYISVNVTVLHN